MYCQRVQTSAVGGGQAAAAAALLEPCCRRIKEGVPVAGGLPLPLWPRHHIKALVQRLVVQQGLDHNLQAMQGRFETGVKLTPACHASSAPSSCGAACLSAATASTPPAPAHLCHIGPRDGPGAGGIVHETVVLAHQQLTLPARLVDQAAC